MMARKAFNCLRSRVMSKGNDFFEKRQFQPSRPFFILAWLALGRSLLRAFPANLPFPDIRNTRKIRRHVNIISMLVDGEARQASDGATFHRTNPSDGRVPARASAAT